MERPDRTPSVPAHVTAALERQRSPFTPLRLAGWVAAGAILAVTFGQSEMDLWMLVRDSGNMASYLAAYFPPDFTDWRFYLQEAAITISMGIWGTLMALVVAPPLAMAASANISPIWLLQPTRRLLDAMRATNVLVFALIFVAAVGLGPFAGVLAIFVHTVGVLGKLFSEAVEGIDPGPVEGITATGANTVQVFVFGVLPQVLPAWISFSLYRFESNIRAAAVLGVVGAGGIGVSLYQSFGSFEYRKVCAILIVLIVATGLIDVISGRLRRLYI